MSVSAIDFYITGGTLPRDAHCYIERMADRDLYKWIIQGKFCYVLTSRQMGKSSLMVRTAARLKAEGRIAVVLDLTSIGLSVTEDQWYGGMLEKIGHQLDLEEETENFWIDYEYLSPLERWLKAVREVVLNKINKSVAIFIDEIDSVKNLPFSTKEFFVSIKSFYDLREKEKEYEKLTFCLFGVALPTDLINDAGNSPFLIGERVSLSDFSVTEAEILIKGFELSKKSNDLLLKRILYWTNGHPYLTQKFCRAVADDEDVRDINGIDRVCDRLFLSNRAKGIEGNLLFVRERLLRSRADLRRVLYFLRRVRKRSCSVINEASQFYEPLLLSGIVSERNGYLEVRNRIYRRVFDRQWIIDNL